MPNRLAHETSPYLLQHAQNPVDWYPWGPEALDRARVEDKPIFLSIGYAACHWCHVMAHESFEDEATVAFLNEHFVAIKVDREERPDLDSIYMDAVVAITGQGGWPMSVFLTPHGVPFFGGTYYPKEARYGMPAFRQVLEAISTAWRNEREKLQSGAEQLKAALRPSSAAPDSVSAARAGVTLRPELLDRARGYLSRAFDRLNGGFGGAPKFPQPMVLDFLLRSAAGGADTRSERADGENRTATEEPLRIVTRTLDKMARGGIYDQLGGGFHRYSVDTLWLVPHFEKMLYDNAQLVTLYLHAWQVTGRELYRRVASETLDYVLREMTHPNGGFFSSQDADSLNAAGELEEGAFFTWTPEEIEAARADGEEPLPADDVRLFGEAYGVTQHGNFEGRTILHEAVDPDVLAERHGLTVDEVERRLERMRRRLFAARTRRAAPARDDKVLTAWNGLMLAAFAEAARVLCRDDYRLAAEANAALLLDNLRDQRGRLLRTWKDGGTAKLNAYLEDYTDLANGLLQLYQTTFDERWFVAARELGDAILEHFADGAGGFYATSDDHEELLRRPRGEEDNAIPSGGAMATLVLVQLAAYTGDDRYAAAAEAALQLMAENAATMPLGFAQWLVALDLYLAPPIEVAIVGEAAGATAGAGDEAEPDEHSLLAAVRSAFRPHVIASAAIDAEHTAVPLLAGRRPVDGRAAAYVCQGFSCTAPVTEADALRGALTR
jgi:uncharacterized protein YyaL (SSP411 family)